MEVLHLWVEFASFYFLTFAIKKNTIVHCLRILGWHRGFVDSDIKLFLLQANA
ncbi:hypothetical protein AZO1586I_717 [Bathymodiolus thermophilus thioautotrophic gill symbiont]|jgi:hypothetical protein|uniref:Uncharacterized protein n=1 Tax=Bathymodiolus thermophilus thioautotrophic gill symbiont TaxID=2360 RepID=A0ABM8M6M5_9GAMM|nr:hypothetical protein AZO1586I_717 [Bathymodiolus thermophilus thioautotrophic gill symbiont]CAC9539226.1 hypothetical protein [uncultured Gammaproteobacteria bacterium]CAC9997851.1 hypothetical protein [uncultured Gammaproteobacteria bacterium]VVH56161.1 hypothetical protein BAZOLSSOX_2635 [uncultured Gammaproteobacteria bacterium]